MLQTSTIQFLKQLAKNNTKEWFDANRKKYEAAKEDFIASLQTILSGISKTDTTLASLAPKDCLFRINRDIRFSKDKSPYKTNFGAYINAGGKKSMLGGYYLHIQPGGCFVGGGMYQPEGDMLKKIRQEIDYNFEEFKSIINSKKFQAVYANGINKDAEYSLSRPPKGYEDSNPAIEFIKLKSIVAIAPLTDSQLTDAKFETTIIKAFETLYPLIIFLNKAAEG